jgi:predicted ATPase
LFREEEGTTVLIDEPELSLHVSWQHTMVDDLTEIASLVGLSFVIATHSTAIINGRWDLVEELGPIDDSVAKADGS